MTGIFYGSTTGNTGDLANEIANKLGVDASDVHDVADASVDEVDKYDCLLLGSSTWGLGDLQDDWEGFIGPLSKKNLSGKKVAFFGCGDSSSYPDTFCDSIGIIRDALKSTGCEFIGAGFTDDYSVTDSKAFENGSPLGLAIDDDEPSKSAGWIEKWISAIK